MAFGGGGSSSSELTAHTHNESLAGDGGQLSQTLTDMNGVTLYSEITDNSAAVAANTAAIAVNTAAIAAIDLVPTGAIIMWSGSVVSIPAGWNICDGTNGTINLGNKFIRSGTSIGTTGGADTVTLTGAESGLKSHSHGISDPGHSHTFNGSGSQYSPYNYARMANDSNSSGSVNSATTGISVSSVAASDASSAHQNMPAYYELAYIQKI
tara:strand:+ start:71 stop:700 length:630 start_codon:yes stop_codon:yes gene_type:complete